MPKQAIRDKHIDAAQPKPPKFKSDDGQLCPTKNQEEWIKAACKATGTEDPDMLAVILLQVVGSLPKRVANDEQWINASAAMLHGIRPRDELEGMLAAQMVAVHTLSMEVSRRAMLPEQSVENVNFNVNRMTKLMRTFTAQLDALQKYRNKGQQKIQVQHVNVNEGGQAVVGNLQQGTG